MTEGLHAVADRLADRYRLGSAVDMEPVAKGAMGRVFRLRTASGQYAAKELFWGVPDPARLGAVVAFTDRCRDAGIPAPRTLATRSGDLVTTHAETGGGWTLQEWVDGSVPDLTDVAVTRWLVRAAALIHSLGIAADGYEHSAEGVGWYCRVVDDFADLAAAAEAVGADWAVPLAQHAASYSELVAVVNAAPIGPTVMSHRDLTNDNVLVGADGRRTLLDWDNAGPHEPWREVGHLCMEHIRDPATVAALVGEYRRYGGAPLRRGVELFATGLAAWLNFLRTRALLALDGQQAGDHRADAAEVVRMMLREIPSLADFERAADAVDRLPSM